MQKKNAYSQEHKKLLMPQHASLELDGILASIINCQLNRHQVKRCYQYKPPENIISCSKKLIWEHNKEHSSANNEKYENKFISTFNNVFKSSFVNKVALKIMFFEILMFL